MKMVPRHGLALAALLVGCYSEVDLKPDQLVELHRVVASGHLGAVDLDGTPTPVRPDDQVNLAVVGQESWHVPIERLALHGDSISTDVSHQPRTLTARIVDIRHASVEVYDRPQTILVAAIFASIGLSLLGGGVALGVACSDSRCGGFLLGPGSF